MTGLALGKCRRPLDEGQQGTERGVAGDEQRGGRGRAAAWAPARFQLETCDSASMRCGEDLAGPSGSPHTSDSQNPPNINFQGEDESACLLSARNECL